MTDLFATSGSATATVEFIDGAIPVLFIDNVYENPAAVRRAALALNYSAGTAHYPGRIGRFPPDDPSLVAFVQKVATLVQREYLPRLPTLPNGQILRQLRGIDTDFAITDQHPERLSINQRKPHVDPVPIFGLIYLNEEPRGGTLFFRSRNEGAHTLLPAAGYPTADHEDLKLAYRIEGRFNRLAIYPGFVLHSGEITGDWIRSDERLNSPRLTQRFQFFP